MREFSFLKPFLVLLACYNAFALPITAGADDRPFPLVVENVSRSVVGVGAAYPPRAPTGGKPPRRLFGTGFAVEREGKSFIVSNAHVVNQSIDRDRREQLAVFSGIGASASQRFAEVVSMDQLHDLALLSYEGARIQPLALASREIVRVGESIAFTGFPIGAVLGLYPATHAGIVAGIAPIARPVDSGRELSAVQLRRMRQPFSVYQLDAIAYPGNSGSAVYRQSTGEVIGIMNSVFVKESRESLLKNPSGIAYAIPVSHLETLLRQLPSD